MIRQTFARQTCISFTKCRHQMQARKNDSPNLANETWILLAECRHSSPMATGEWLAGAQITQLAARCHNVNMGFQKLEPISFDLMYVDK